MSSDVDAAAAGIVLLAEHMHDWVRPEEQDLVRSVLAAVSSQLQANRSDRITIAGAANLLRPGEFGASLPDVLEAIEEQVTLLKLFDELVHDERKVAASIGRENEAYGLAEASVIASSYETDGTSVSRLGVLGPVRMDYAANIAAVRAVARYLHRLLGEDS